MKSLITRIEKFTRKSAVLLDYLFWVLFDFSKFKFIKREKIKKILIIHLGAMGELLILTPLLPLIKKQLNNPDIMFMVSPGKEEVLKNNPYISKIMTYKNNSKADFQQIKIQNFDTVI